MVETVRRVKPNRSQAYSNNPLRGLLEYWTTVFRLGALVITDEESVIEETQMLKQLSRRLPLRSL